MTTAFTVATCWGLLGLVGACVPACARAPAETRSLASSVPIPSARSSSSADAGSSVARDGDRLAALPRSGKAVTDFVPAGWILRQQMKGELGGTDHPDAVLEIVEKLVDPDASVDGPRGAIVVLLGGADGWRRIGLSEQLVLCAQCGGAMWGGDLPWTGLEFADGTLDVSVMWGARDQSSQSWKFRYDGSTGRLRCVSTTYGTRDRLTGSSMATFRDYVAGREVETRDVEDAQGNVTPMPPRTRSVPVTILTFENVTIEWPE